ncbi:MAG TPA: serine/threonine-protein kinase [Polyangiaceae bacterium]
MSDHADPFARTDADPALRPGTLLAGKFRIERRLGAGAMGAVYAIVHELTRHRRAMKLLHPDAQQVPDLVRRFLDEASAAGRAGDPHLVETFDAGVLPTGEAYLIMELLEGETLDALLTREGPLPVSQAAEIVAQAAEGIDAANRAGIIHRDIKPANLFVTSVQGKPFVKVLDFGVSKFATTTRVQLRTTQPGAVFGSPAYMAPEQMQGEADLDARVDVFGLGVVLFECLTKALPYDAPTLQGLVARLVAGRPTAVASLRPEMPEELAAVVHRAVAQKRDERYATAGELAGALAAFRPYDAGARAIPEPRAPSRRLPSRAAMVRATVFLLVVAGGCLAALALTRPKEAARKANPAVESPSAPPPATAPATVVVNPPRPVEPALSATEVLPPPSTATTPPSPPAAAQATKPARGHVVSSAEPARPAIAPAAPPASASARSNSSRIGLAKSPFDP